MEGDAREIFARRIQDYMQKALREAKVHSSWVSPNEDWESAVRTFVDAILRPGPANTFLTEFVAFQQPIARAAVYASLAQTVLKITSPGVPDFYQGSELWDLHLVDPDNRRPVDFALRRRVLESLTRAAGKSRADLACRLLHAPEDGRIKMLVTHLGLATRRAHRELFAEGSYLPLDTAGARAGHLLGFARVLGQEAVIVLAGRLFLALGAAERLPVGERAWSRTFVGVPDGVPPGTYRDAFTDIECDVGRDGLSVPCVLAHLPVALLERMP
jgi:(1->4)-alpha-D-glucan 1-alpha-D-glucosylmutase